MNNEQETRNVELKKFKIEKMNNEFGEIVYDTQSLTAGVYQYRLSLNGN